MAKSVYRQGELKATILTNDAIFLIVQVNLICISDSVSLIDCATKFFRGNKDPSIFNDQLQVSLFTITKETISIVHHIVSNQFYRGLIFIAG